LVLNRLLLIFMAGVAAVAAPWVHATPLQAFEPVQGLGALRYYQSPATAPRHAVIAIHGHPRDARRTFEAAREAVEGSNTLVIAPLFQVDERHADRCASAGEPAAQSNDLLWSCASWIAGAPASNAPTVTAFGALDALVAEVHKRFPSVTTITLAGFSAGAQMVQHSIAFAAPAPPGLALRYVVADPGSWLYFHPWRAQPSSDCQEVDQWKYGLQGLPAWLPQDLAAARRPDAAADIDYLEGELDSSAAKGTFFPILDKSCAALAQGSFRLQRGQAYVQYEEQILKPPRPRPLTVVPGCAHAVDCVFASAPGRAALLGQSR
jgi:hypothetical protein